VKLKATIKKAIFNLGIFQAKLSKAIAYGCAENNTHVDSTDVHA
jgi:hypothetical protein